MTFILNIGNYITLPCHSHRCCLWTSTGAWIGITQLRSRRGIIIFSLLVYVPVLATAFSVFKQNNEWQRQTIMNDWERPVAIICPAAGHDNTGNIWSHYLGRKHTRGERKPFMKMIACRSVTNKYKHGILRSYHDLQSQHSCKSYDLIRTGIFNTLAIKKIWNKLVG